MLLGSGAVFANIVPDHRDTLIWSAIISIKIGMALFGCSTLIFALFQKYLEPPR